MSPADHVLTTCAPVEKYLLRAMQLAKLNG